MRSLVCFIFVWCFPSGPIFGHAVCLCVCVFGYVCVCACLSVRPCFHLVSHTNQNHRAQFHLHFPWRLHVTLLHVTLLFNSLNNFFVKWKHNKNNSTIINQKKKNTDHNECVICRPYICLMVSHLLHTTYDFTSHYSYVGFVFFTFI